MVTPVRVVLTLLNRSVTPPPRVCAPTAIARATNTMSMAYSVAVAPLSLCLNVLIKQNINLSSTADREGGALAIASLPTPSVAVLHQYAVQSASEDRPPL